MRCQRSPSMPPGPWRGGCTGERVSCSRLTYLAATRSLSGSPSPVPHGKRKLHTAPDIQDIQDIQEIYTTRHTRHTGRPPIQHCSAACEGGAAQQRQRTAEAGQLRARCATFASAWTLRTCMSVEHRDGVAMQSSRSRRPPLATRRPPHALSALFLALGSCRASPRQVRPTHKSPVGPTPQPGLSAMVQPLCPGLPAP